MNFRLDWSNRTYLSILYIISLNPQPYLSSWRNRTLRPNKHKRTNKPAHIRGDQVIGQRRDIVRIHKSHGPFPPIEETPIDKKARIRYKRHNNGRRNVVRARRPIGNAGRVLRIPRLGGVLLYQPAVRHRQGANADVAIVISERDVHDTCDYE